MEFFCLTYIIHLQLYLPFSSGNKWRQQNNSQEYELLIQNFSLIFSNWCIPRQLVKHVIIRSVNSQTSLIFFVQTKRSSFSCLLVTGDFIGPHACLNQIPGTLPVDSGFQSLVGFGIPFRVFRNQKPNIPDDTSTKISRIPNFPSKTSRIPEFVFLTWGEGNSSSPIHS